MAPKSFTDENFSKPCAYVVACHKTALFKVGHTKNLRRRLSALEVQEKSPVFLEGVIFVGTKDIAKDVERFVQAKLKDHRSGSGREWFACSQGALRGALYDAIEQFGSDVQHIAGIAAPRLPNDSTVYSGVDVRTASRA